MQWAISWDEYISGVMSKEGHRIPRVPSEHARQLIQTFLLSTQARSQDSDSEDDVADKLDAEEELPNIS